MEPKYLSNIINNLPKPLKTEARSVLFRELTFRCRRSGICMAEHGHEGRIDFLNKRFSTSHFQFIQNFETTFFSRMGMSFRPGRYDRDFRPKQAASRLIDLLPSLKHLNVKVNLWISTPDVKRERVAVDCIRDLLHALHRVPEVVMMIQACVSRNASGTELCERVLASPAAMPIVNDFVLQGSTTLNRYIKLSGLSYEYEGVDKWAHCFIFARKGVVASEAERFYHQVMNTDEPWWRAK